MSSNKEAIRLVDRKGNKNEKRYIMVGGKQCEVEAFDPKKRLRPVTTTKGVAAPPLQVMNGGAWSRGVLKVDKDGFVTITK